jgi:AcrR family transcriptional regulator
MRSIPRAADRPAQDLTAKARIRDAALEQFGEHGVDGATIRGIAAAAGVSPGLVQHHFGSKERLRDECDETVLTLVRRKMEAVKRDELADPSVLASLYAAGPRLVRYLARAVIDGSPGAAALLDQIEARTEDFFSGTWPDRFPPGDQRTRDAATVLLSQALGTIVLHEHVARLMGLEPWTDILSPRIGLAQLDAYEAVGAFVASGWGDEIRGAIATVRTVSPDGKEQHRDG